MIEWQNIPENYDDYVGFVYKICEKNSRMFYYGITRYWKVDKKAPTKYKRKDGKYLKNKNNKRILETRTTKKHIKKETDWRTYNTSMGDGYLAKEIRNNPDNYEKIIIRNCKTLCELKGYEAYMVLSEFFDGNWNACYNRMVDLKMSLSEKGGRQ